MKCPRCSEDMVAYVSAPIAKHPTERRLIFPAGVECSRLEMKINRMQSPVRHLQNWTQRFLDVRALQNLCS